MDSKTAVERVFVAGSLDSMVAGDTSRTGDCAIAVRDGVIVAVGGFADARGAVGPAAEVVDLDGGHLMPGINDAHIHVASWGASLPPLAVDVSYPGVGSIADVIERIRTRAAETPAGSWIVGGGWSTATLAECSEQPGRLPTRQELDRATRDHPVLLDDDSLHAVWVNSQALERAGVSATTPDPVGGEVVRDGSGVPTGVLKEFAAKALIERALPEVTVADRAVAIREAIRRLQRLGITSATDPAVGPGGGRSPMGMPTWAAYAQLALAGELGLRVSLLLLPGRGEALTAAQVRHDITEAALPPVDPRRLRLAGVKLFADGIPPLHTAWMNEPYQGCNHRGALAVSGDTDDERVRQLREIVEVVHRGGLQLGVHATGDAAVDAVTEALAACLIETARPNRPGRAGVRNPLRHYVIHGDFVSARSLALLAEHGIGVSTQMELLAFAQEQSQALVGEHRANQQWPVRSLLEHGVPVSFGSDVPAAPSPDWRLGAAAAVLRRSALSGSVSGPSERITAREALRAYTVGGAWQDRAEAWKGTLEVGKVADFCVVAADLTTVAPEAWAEVGITHTVLGGELVYGG